ncbi:DUF2089 domain-containing protein [bacterium]|nr:DUF2089 domain-containing protein [bacterium]
MADTTYEIPGTCPACGHAMHARVLHCDNCGTEVSGDFTLGRFARLSPEQLSFLETFISCRGNLKDVGTKLNMSYPTTRGRLDSLLVALGYADAVEEPEAEHTAPARRGRKRAEA